MFYIKIENYIVIEYMYNMVYIYSITIWNAYYQKQMNVVFPMRC